MTVFAKLAGRAERMASTLSFEAAVQVVASRRGLTPDAVRAPSPSPRVRDAVTGRLSHVPSEACRARQEALYLAAIVFGRPVRSVARAAGLSAPAVLKALRAVESRRDDKALDRRLDELELELLPGSTP